jgi:hypothetical protein
MGRVARDLNTVALWSTWCAFDRRGMPYPQLLMTSYRLDPLRYLAENPPKAGDLRAGIVVVAEKLTSPEENSQNVHGGTDKADISVRLAPFVSILSTSSSLALLPPASAFQFFLSKG